MKRHDLVTRGEWCGVQPAKNGAWVRYDEAQAEIDAALTRVAELEEEENHEPGELIAKVSCPICGSGLSVEYGDDPGKIGVLGSPSDYVTRLRAERDTALQRVAELEAKHNHEQEIMDPTPLSELR